MSQNGQTHFKNLAVNAEFVLKLTLFRICLAEVVFVENPRNQQVKNCFLGN